MIQEGKFGVQEAVWLTLITTCNKLFFTSPAWLTNYVGTAGWQMTIISCMTSFVAFSFIYLLLKRFPGKNIIEIFSMSLGKFFGFLFSMMFAIAFLQEASILMREFTEVIKVYVFPDTSTELLAISFVVTVATVSYLGLETIARVAKLSGYALLLIFLVLCVLAAKDFSLTNLFPILGYGIGPTVKNGLLRSSSYSEIIIIAVFAGSLQGAKYVRKAGLISIAASGLILTFGLVLIGLAFPVQTLQELIAPVFVIARGIRYGSFFQRLDALFLFLWFFAAFISVTALFYCAKSCYCKAFRLDDMRPVIFPMSVLIYALAFIPRDFTEVIQGNVQTLRSYAWAVFYVLPLITLIVAALRKKRGTS